MGISDSIDRLTAYYSRHGFAATIRRAVVGTKRAFFANRMVVLYCDLTELTPRRAKLSSSLKFQRLRSEHELDHQDLQEIASLWNPKQAQRNIAERFEKGASLWLIKSAGNLAGYGWTIRGCTIAPYYFPLGPDDVQLFDFSVLPRFRGRALHWVLTFYILRALAAEGATRAFADTAEWNQAQLSSFKMTPFRRLGLVRTFKLPGKMIISWVNGGAPEQALASKAAQSEGAKVGVGSRE
ncbi:MAG: GNAT family N-acetyltransferase [Candidatus Acidiferrum sp.]